MNDEMGDFDELDNLINDNDLNIDGLDEDIDDTDSPIKSVVKNFNMALSDEATIRNISKSFKKSILKTLPQNINNDISNSEDIMFSTLDYIENAVNPLKQTLSSTIGNVADILPDNIATPLLRMREYLTVGNSDSYVEPTEDEKIRSEVEGILGSRITAESIKDSIHENIKNLLAKKDTELLATITANTNKLVLFKSEFDNSYYRRSLELQIKQTYTTIKLYDLLKRDSEIRTRQLEAIVKNTGLPDIVKTKTSDVFKETLMRDTSSNILSMFNKNDTIKNLTQNIQNKINTSIENVASKFDALNMAADVIKMQEDMGISKTQAVMSMGIDYGIGKVTDKSAAVLLNRLSKTEDGKQILANMEKYSSDPRKGLEEALKNIEAKRTNESNLELNKPFNKNTTSKVKPLDKINEIKNDITIKTIRNLLDVLGNESDARIVDFSKTNELKAPTMLDNKFKKAVETVIPNLLSKILLEVTAIRKGSRDIKNDESLIFDYKANRFMTKKEVKKKTISDVKDKTKSLITDLANSKLEKTLLNNETLTKDEKIEFNKGLLEYILDNKSTSPYFMLSDGILNYIEDEELANKVKTNLLKLENTKDPKVIETIKEAQTTINNLKNQISSFSGIGEHIENIGSSDILTEIGLSDDYKTITTGNMKNVYLKNSKEILESTYDNIPDKEFYKGGYTGDGDKYEVAGIVHKGEYVLTQEKLNDLIKNVEDGNKTKLEEIATNIVKNVDEKSKIVDLNTTVNKLKEDMDSKLSSLIVNKDETSKDNENKYSKSILNKLTDKIDGISKTITDLKTTFKKDTVNIKENLLSKDYNILNNKSIVKFKTSDNNIHNKIINNISNAIPTTKDDIYKLYETIQDKISILLKSISTNFDNVISNIPNMFNVLKDGMVNTFSNIYDKTSTIMKNLNDTLTKSFFNLKSTTTSIFDTGLKSIKNTKIDNISNIDLKPTNILKTVKTSSIKMFNDLQSTFSNVPDLTSEVTEDIKTINNMVNKGDTVKLLRKALAGKPLPEDEESAIVEYRVIFNTIDPSGGLWNKVKEKPTFLNDIEKLHIEVLENEQKGILGKSIDMIDSGLTGMKGMIGNVRDNLINMLPEPLKGPAQKLLDNRFTKYIGNTVGRLKNAGKSALKTTLDELKIIGHEGKELFIDPETGKLVLPNAVSLAKFAGKSYFKSMGAVGKGVRELYTETGGVLKDTTKLGLKTAWDVVGINRFAKHKINRIKAKIKPPINRELYKAWTSGALTANEVMDELPTEEEKAVWKEWLKANTRPGLTLPDMLLSGGEWFVKGMVGSAPTIRNIYKTTGKAAQTITKKSISTAWKFSGIGQEFQKTKAKVKGSIKPPIDNNLFKLWANGYYNGKEILDKLPTEEEREAWRSWLEVNMPKGYTVIDVLKKSGEWFIGGMLGSSKVIKPTYTNIGNLATTTVKGLTKATWKFSGIPYEIEKHKVRSTFEQEQPIPNHLYDKYQNNESDGQDIFHKLENNYQKSRWLDLMEVENKGKNTISSFIKTVPDLYKQSKKYINDKNTTTNSDVNNNVTNNSVDNNNNNNSNINNIIEVIKDNRRDNVILKESLLNKITNIFNKYKTPVVNTTIATTNNIKDSITELIEKKENIKDINTRLEVEQVEALKETNTTLKEMTTTIKDNKVKSPFDRDNDGDRDGNIKDRYEKLYGKKEEGGVLNSIKHFRDKYLDFMNILKGKGTIFNVRVVDNGSFFNSTNMLLMGAGIAAALGFKNSNSLSKFLEGIKDGITMVAKGVSSIYNAIKSTIKFMKDSFYYLKSLPEGISLSLHKIFHKVVPSLIDAPTRKELLAYDAHLKGELSDEEKLKKEEEKLKPDYQEKLDEESISSGKAVVLSTAGMLAAKKTYDIGKGAFNVTKKTINGVKNIMPNKKSIPQQSMSKVVNKTIPKSNTIKTISKAGKKALPTSKILSYLKLIKNKLIKKLGINAAGKLLSKIAARFVPVLGWTLAGYDAIKASYYMMHDKLSLGSAISKAVIGFDLFNNDEVPIDENGEPIKPDIPENEIEKAKKKLLIKKSLSPISKRESKQWVNDYNNNITRDMVNNNDNVANIKLPKIRFNNIKLPIKTVMEEIKEDEGIVLNKYKDHLGYETIGIGHLLDKRKGGIPLHKIIGRDKDVIEPEEADYILLYDISRISNELYSKLPWLKTQPMEIQKDLTNASFNLGTTGLLKFHKAINYIKNYDYENAANEFENSKWYHQVGDRAKRLVNNIRNIGYKLNMDNISQKPKKINDDERKQIINELTKLQKHDKALLEDKKESTKAIHTTQIKPSKEVLKTSKLNKSVTPNIQINNNIDTDNIDKAINVSNELLDKSVVIQTNIYDKLDEMVKLQQQQITIMKSDYKHTTNNKVNNKKRNYNDDHVDTVMNHSTAKF